MVDIIEIVKKEGASIVGIADLSSLPEEARCSMPIGIAIGIALDAKITSNIPNGPFLEYFNEYNKVTAKLGEICISTSNYLIENGFSAIPQTVDYIKQQRENTESKRAILPHKTVSALAGFGWIGKSSLLITKEYGSALRLTTILTNAPLEAVKSEYSCLCGECTKCVDNCPGNAIKNQKWSIDIDRDDLIDFQACRRTVKERGKKFSKDHAMCGICVAVCPYTQRYLKQGKI